MQIFNYFKKLDKLKNKIFSSIVVSVITGSLFSQIIPILFYPLLTKIYTPEEFGVVSSLMTLSTFLSILVTFKYESAIFLADSKNEALDIFTFVLIISGFFIVIIYVFLILFASQINTILIKYNFNFGNYIYFIPIIAYALVVYNCFNEWCVSNRSYKSLTNNKITNSAITVLSKIIFGLINTISNGMVIGEVFGRIFSGVISLLKLIKNEWNNVRMLTYCQIINISKKYIKFPKYTLLDQIISQLNALFPIFMIGKHFGLIELGYFSMSITILSLPISVLSLSIRDVFRKKFHESSKSNEIQKKYFLKTLIYLIALALIILVVLFFCIPVLFNFFFSKVWHNSEIFSIILLPSSILGLISMSLSGVLIVNNHNHLSMIWQLIYFLLVLLFLYISIFLFKKNIFITILFYSIARGVSYIIYIYMSYYSIKRK